jgi:hypothetical protein
MNEQTYLKDRVDGQIGWMEQKALNNQKTYKALRTASLIASVLIPLLAGYAEKFGTSLTITIGALGAVVAICQGLLAINRNHENWTEYRITAEVLKREKLFYETKTVPYECDNRFGIFVENIEKILSGENKNWIQNNRESEKKTK